MSFSFLHHSDVLGWSYGNRLLGVLGVGLWLLIGGCGMGGEASPEGVVADSLVAVPALDLNAVEPNVREQILAAQAALDAALADPQMPATTLSERFGDLGKHFLAYEYPVPAILSFRNAQHLSPRDERWAYYLGHLYLDEGDLDQSRAQFEWALHLKRGYIPALLALATMHIEAYQLDEAESVLDRIPETQSKTAAVLFERGRIALQREAYSEAVTHLQQALRQDPDASAIHYPLGLAYRGLGNTTSAQAFLEKRGSEQPTLDDPLMEQIDALLVGRYAYQNLGNEAYLRGQYEEARAAFEQAVAINPESAETHTNLGVALTQVEAFEEAAAAFETALRLDPDYALANFSMASLLARQQRDESAVPYYRKALALNPDYKQAHYNLANALFRLQRYGEAVAHYERIVELEPSNTPARYGQALCLMHIARWSEAHRVLEVAHRLAPENRPIAATFARLLASCPETVWRDGARALTLAQALVEQERSLAHIEVLAMALAEVGRYEEAIQYQKAGLEAARQAGRTDLVASLSVNLERYERREPARNPLP